MAWGQLVVLMALGLSGRKKRCSPADAHSGFHMKDKILAGWTRGLAQVPSLQYPTISAEKVGYTGQVPLWHPRVTYVSNGILAACMLAFLRLPPLLLNHHLNLYNECYISSKTLLWKNKAKKVTDPSSASRARPAWTQLPTLHGSLIGSGPGGIHPLLCKSEPDPSKWQCFSLPVYRQVLGQGEWKKHHELLI